MDAGEAECPGDWPNTEVEDREFAGELSAWVMVLPSGEIVGEAPTGTMWVACWK